MDDATQRLVDDVMAYAQREGLTDRGIAQAAVRMTLEAAHRPLVSPEQREAMEWAGIKALVESAEVPTGVRAHLLGEVFTIREAVDAEPVVQVILDAILARFTIPTLDVEKVARLLYSFDPEIQMWNGEPYVYSEPGAKSQRKRARKWAKRLVEALPTLTADTERSES